MVDVRASTEGGLRSPADSRRRPIGRGQREHAEDYVAQRGNFRDAVRKMSRPRSAPRASFCLTAFGSQWEGPRPQNQAESSGRSDGGVRTGSHNLILGYQNDYTSYGGFAAGDYNTITASFASVSGGGANRVSAPGASVSGGSHNTVSGAYASVSGGTSLTQPATDGWAAGSLAPGNVIVGDFESP